MWLKSLVNAIIINIILALDVGEECTPSKDVSEGICNIITDCEIALRMIMTGGRHNLSRCGFSGVMEIVCCPKSTTRFGTAPPPVLLSSSPPTATGIPTDEPPRRSLRIADRECENIKATVRPPLRLNIINGVVATRGEFQAMVALGFPRDRGYSFDCGGTLISNTYVLTAAHCIDNLDGVKPEIVRVGVAELGDTFWNDETDYRVSAINNHPNYLPREKYHDIALIRLEKPVEVNVNQAPACLYTNSEEPKTPLTITGWGTINTTTRAISNVLLKASLKVVPREICGQNYTRWRKLPRGISDDQICAADPQGLSDACQGDSGGPLLQTTTTDDVTWIVGVTSFGAGCATSTPGVYTRISRYLDWIESVVWPN